MKEKLTNNLIIHYLKGKESDFKTWQALDEIMEEAAPMDQDDAEQQEDCLVNHVAGMPLLAPPLSQRAQNLLKALIFPTLHWVEALNPGTTVTSLMQNRRTSRCQLCTHIQWYVNFCLCVLSSARGC
jgi:hypothetical protein